MPIPEIRVGQGYDSHRLVAGRPLILGGVTIPFEKGLDGHSDADVLLHAVTDAVLGLLRWATSARTSRLQIRNGKVRTAGNCSRPSWISAQADGWQVVNLDATVICERPKLERAEGADSCQCGQAPRRCTRSSQH